MAQYHKDLRYHEDNIQKHEITKEEINFLKELQHELNTQDTVCQANPRFWVIKGSEKFYDVKDDADGYELIQDTEVIAANMEEAYEFLDGINKGLGKEGIRI